MKPTVSEHAGEEQLSLAKYVVGFVCSVVLTMMAYVLATRQNYSKDVVVGALTGLALVQFVTQRVFFLHVGSERRPRWKLVVMFWMLGVVLILVLGSLWIMNNLNYRMTPQEVQQYLKSQDAL
jgi:cytochrome o ubiquinol oxidase operon protein cyoD